MNVLKAIRAKLIGDAAVKELLPGNQCYAVVAPQGAAMPFVVLSVVGNDPNDTKSGVSDVDAFRIQIDSYALTYDGCQDLDEKCRTVIDKYMGPSIDDINIDGVRYLSSLDFFENDPQEYRRSSDYTVRIKYS